MAIFWFNKFVDSRLSSESFELLIVLLAYLEPKLWLKKQKLEKILLSQTLTLGILYPCQAMAIPCQQIKLESCSNPLKVLYFIIKKIFTFGCLLFC